MADNEKRFLNYENSMSIYRSKTAIIVGTLYFTKGYQSTPVLGMQFAQCADPKAEQKVFNWDADEKVWYFPTYDKIFELYRKINKWKAAISLLKAEKITDDKVISERYKELAEQTKIANPLKKKTLYTSISYYNGYFFKFGFSSSSSGDGRTTVNVALYEDEMEMLIQYIGDFIRNYHNLGLLHRMMNGVIGAGSKKPYSAPTEKPESEPTRPATTRQSPPTPPAAETTSSGSSLDDIMNSLNAGSDDDIPF